LTGRRIYKFALFDLGDLHGYLAGFSSFNNNPITHKKLEFGILSDEISLNLEEALREGKAMGFRKYELRCMDSYEERVPYIKKAYEERILKAIENNEIEVTALTPGLFKIRLSEVETLKRQMDETLPQTCEMARRMNVTLLILFGFLREKGKNNEHAIEKIREAGSIAEDFNIRIAIENEPHSFCDTGANTAEIIRAVGMENVGINWDPGNALSSGEVAYPVGYEAVKPYLMNVHIKDTIPLPPDKWENRIVGEGGVNWVGQLKALIKDRMLTHLTLETHVFPLLESTREDLRRLNILLDTIESIEQGTNTNG